jgi:ATP-dependent protease ClpP protease subunit
MPQSKTEPQNFSITSEGSTAKVLMYGTIHEWSENNSQDIAERLAALDVSRIELELHSRGGSILEGVAIHNALKGHKAHVECTVMGAALSIASHIAMAADVIRMPKNAFMMLHRPRMVAIGESERLRSDADQLDQMEHTLIDSYAERTGQPRETIAEMMRPGQETWLRAGECKDKGFCDELIEPVRMAAGPLDLSSFETVPDWAEALMQSDLSPPDTPAEPKIEEATNVADQDTTRKPATLAELKKEFPDASAEFYMQEIEAESPIQQAAVNYAKACKAETDAAKKEAAKAKQAAENAAKNGGGDGLGVNPLGAGGDGADDHDGQEDDPVAEFNDAVCMMIDRGLSRRKAVSQVAQRNPELHKRYLLATNSDDMSTRQDIDAYFAELTK